MSTLAHMWTGFVATWPIWLFIAILVGASFAILGDEQKTRKSQRIQDARAEENRKTLQFIREQQQRDRAKAAQRRGQDSPYTTTDRALRIAPVTSIDEARRDVRRDRKGGAA